jgi:hypothetical protein
MFSSSTATICALFLALVCFAWGTEAHLCMKTPAQRGGYDGSDEPGADICYVKEGPCGVIGGDYSLKVFQNQIVTINFQKNVNHYVNNGGYFQLNVFDNELFTSKTLFTILDTNSPDLTEFNVDVFIDDAVINQGNNTFQMLYNTGRNIPGFGDETYYSCADVLVIGNSTLSDEVNQLKF